MMMTISTVNNTTTAPADAPATSAIEPPNETVVGIAVGVELNVVAFVSRGETRAVRDGNATWMVVVGSMDCSAWCV